MSRISVLTTVAVLAGAAAGARAEGPGGIYDISGWDPRGAIYSGTATVTVTGETTADIAIEVPAGASVGQCIVTDTHVACHVDTGGGHYAMSIYTRMPDGVLEGHWTHSGLRGLGQETLTPKP